MPVSYRPYSLLWVCRFWPLVDGLRERGQHRLRLDMVTLDGCDLRPKACDHLVQALRLFSEIVILSKVCPHGQIPSGDRPKDLPETVEGTCNSMRDKGRVEGKQHKDDQHGGPDPRMESEELTGQFSLFDDGGAAAPKLENQGEKEGSRKYQKDNAEIEKIDEQEPILITLDQNAPSLVRACGHL